jgi:hypothetical protein
MSAHRSSDNHSSAARFPQWLAALDQGQDHGSRTNRALNESFVDKSFVDKSFVDKSFVDRTKVSWTDGTLTLWEQMGTKVRI